MPDFETLLVVSVTPPEVVTLVEEQLDWPPPTLDDPAPWKPLGVVAASKSTAPLGPIVVDRREQQKLELRPTLELLEQLPELPLTLV